MTISDRSSAGFALSLGIAWLSCGGPDSAQETVFDDTAPADSAVVETEAGAPNAEDPFFGFDIDRESDQGNEERLLALRLRNAGGEDALVFADAGAGEVFLDSVPAGKWSRVDLLTRGPVVTLRTARPSGETIHQLDLAAVPDSVFDVNVGDPAATP